MLGGRRSAWASPTTRLGAQVWIVLACCGGCDQRTKDLRQWSPADHDRGGEPLAQPAAPMSSSPHEGEDMGDESPPSASPHQEGGGAVFAAWAKTCVPCHGRVGRGDGPNRGDAPLPDLSDPAWQLRVSDAELARVIREGKNGMPPSSLPAAVVEGLVGLVRQIGGGPPGQPSAPLPQGSLSASPLASAAPLTPQPSIPAR